MGDPERVYLLPFAPGVLLVLAGAAIELVRRGRPRLHVAIGLGVALLLAAATGVAVLLLNRRAVRALEREIEALD